MLLFDNDRVIGLIAPITAEELATMTKNLRKRLGLQVKNLREAAGKTQQEVADLLGIYQSDLAAFESRGEKIGSMERVEALLNLFGYELAPAEKNFIDLRVEVSDFEAIAV